MMIYRRWVRASTSTSLTRVRSRACAFHTDLLPRRQVLFGFISFRSYFFGPCSESSARASSSWFDLRCNAEHVTVSFVNSMHTHPVCVCARASDFVWVFELRKFNRLYRYTYCVCFFRLHYYSIFFTNAWRIEKRLPIAMEKGVLCLVAVVVFFIFGFFRLLSLRTDHTRYQNVEETTTATTTTNGENETKW